jgi:hypothetical protein
VAGPSITRDHVRGLVDYKMYEPRENPPIDQYNSHLGITVGADLERRLGRRTTLRVPVRVTRLFNGKTAYVDSSLDLHAGVEITFNWFRWVSFR